jgi:hypothetical protein
VAAGVVCAYLLLAATALWARTQCLPVSTNEFKWQCAAIVWTVALVYLASTFVATYAAKTALVAVAVFVLVFGGHMYLPQFGLVSLGKSWYLDPAALLFVTAAVFGAALAALLNATASRRR